jgi:hypothetical protein
MTCASPRDPWESTLQALAALPDLTTARLLLCERIRRAPPGEAARGVEVLLRRALDGHRGARRALVGLAVALVEEPIEGGRALRRRLQEGAAAEGRAVVSALLAEGPARLGLAPRGRLREVGIGEESLLPSIDPGGLARKYLATRIELLRLHPSPRMVARVLRQRWLHLDDVLIIAARRPTTGAIARRVVMSPWIGDVRVREALVQNPFTPAGVALPLLPSVRLPVLQEFRRSGAHAPIADAAGRLIALRRVEATSPAPATGPA